MFNCSWDGRREISQSRRPMKWVPPPDQFFFVAIFATLLSSIMSTRNSICQLRIQKWLVFLTALRLIKETTIENSKNINQRLKMFFDSVDVHKFVLTASSPVFASPVSILPLDFYVQLLTKFLSFVYTCLINLSLLRKVNSTIFDRGRRTFE